MEKSKVFFTKTITKEKLIEMFELLNIKLDGNIGIKVHSGEEGNKNYIKPEFFLPLIDKIKGTIIECNTAYPGSRNETKLHESLMNRHGWTKYFKVDIMDSENGLVELPIINHNVIDKNYVGSHLDNYDSILVLSHFKGHPMGGFGGALKQLSIGFASSEGKANIHSGGKTLDQNILWNNICSQEDFMASMADAASSITNKYKNRIAYINVLVNLSVDCDCCSDAENPCMNDIGIMSSLDPVALDKACIDKVINSNDPGKDKFMERVNSRKGMLILDYASKLEIGSKDYDLIEIE